jgi:MoxR-like ATPase
MKLRVDIPDRQTEATLLDAFDADPERGVSDVMAVVDDTDIEAARRAVGKVFVTEAVRDYILDIVDATRTNADITHGASPRAAIALLQVSKARAATRSRAYVIPDDPKALATRVLAHRLVLSTEAELSDVAPEEVVRDVLEAVTTPNVTEADLPTAVVGDGGDAVRKPEE